MKIGALIVISLILLNNVNGSEEYSEGRYKKSDLSESYSRRYEPSSSLDASSENSDFLKLDYSQSNIEDSVSLINEDLMVNKLFSSFIFENDVRDLVLSDNCFSVGLYEESSKKKFKSYMKTIIKEYILNSKLHSWFYRLWSSSTVITTPVLYIERRTEFKELYDVAKKAYKRLKDSGVIIILKISTKGVARELKEEEESSIQDYSRDTEISNNFENSENSLELKTSVVQAVKSLCIKLRSLSKHRNRDNGQSYMFVIEAYDVTNRSLLYSLMTNMIYTSCWNRSNINKSRIIIPIIIGNFKDKERKGILNDIYLNKHKKKRRNKRRSSKHNRKSNRRKKNFSSSLEINENDFNINNNDEKTVDVNKENNGENNEENDEDNNEDKYKSLFIKWIKKCNESKILFDKYEKINSGLFNRLLAQYLIYAINNKSITKSLIENNNFLLNYPIDCQDSWNSLIVLVESEFKNANNREQTVNSIIDSLSMANTSLFKDEDQLPMELNDNENQKQVYSEVESNKDQNNNLVIESDYKTLISENKSKLTEVPETSELLSIISNRDQTPVELITIRIFDDLLIRLLELPDHRKSRIEFKSYLSIVVKTFGENNDLNTQLYQLFEAIDYTQNSFHILRVLFINSIDFGLTFNPLELLIDICRNAKLIPFNTNNNNNNNNDQEEEPSLDDLNQDQAEDECNPLTFLTQDLLNDDYDGDIMEPIQKSSIKYISLLLRLSQYNLQTLNIHVSNLIIKVERLLLSNSLDINKIPNLVLILYEKIQTMPFNTLSSFSYLKEIKDNKVSLQLNPVIPLFTSYTLIGLYGEIILPENSYEISRVLLMEICLLYYYPKVLLEPEFVNLCNLSWNYNKKEFYNAVKNAISHCKKVSEKSSIENNSKTIFLICHYLNKLKNGFNSRSIEFTDTLERYIPKEFDNRCENIKSYSIQQSNGLYTKFSELFKNE